MTYIAFFVVGLLFFKNRDYKHFFGLVTLKITKEYEIVQIEEIKEKKKKTFINFKKIYLYFFTCILYYVSILKISEIK